MENLPAVQVRLESLFSGEIEQWGVDAVEVASLFSDLCSAYKRVFLLLDGLDKVDPNDGRVIRNFLKVSHLSRLLSLLTLRWICLRSL